MKVTLPDLTAMKRRGERIAMVTAYDASSAALAEAAGIDLVLVGDSAAMTVLGHDSTLPVTVDEMLMLTRAVSRRISRAVVIADMPFGSYQISDEAAIEHAVRFLKAGADAVKLEGAGRTITRVRALIDAGIAVMGHLGLTPQSATLLGGYKTQGRTARNARGFLEAARALEQVGAFGIVLEAMPAPVAAHISAALTIPTIGIGAGAACDGQVLVWHDLLGISSGHVPRFVKPYADLKHTILRALGAYVADVRAGTFPDAEHSYAMPEEELREFESDLAAAATGRGRGSGNSSD